MRITERAIESSELLDAAMRDRAVERIRAGLAGDGEEDCVACGQPIGAARRAALPSAERCIGCQTKLERRVL